MLRSNRHGFTLIELLTVIAIIAILAAMVFSGFGIIREMAKERAVDNAFLQIRSSAAAYYSQNGSYPVPIGGVIPAHKAIYAEIVANTVTPADGSLYWQTFQVRPYTFAIGIHDDEAYLDPFSIQGYDTDLDGNISLLEYLPLGFKPNPVAAPIFETDLPPTGTAALQNEIPRLQAASQRPYTYIAVNKAQAKAAARFWINQNPPDKYATNWNWGDPNLASVTVPPPSYDAFVLISMGRGGETGGILADAPFLNNSTICRTMGEMYHLANLRAFFLATRDWDDDGTKDLTYEGKGTRGDSYAVNGITDTYNMLPPGALSPAGYGAKVFVYGYD